MAMASCSKLPAAAASAGRFQDLPAELVERIMLPLDHRDRARCEMVCTRWLAVSRRSPALWGRVEWVYSAGDQRELAELRWLARHGPVRQAVLDLAEYRLADGTGFHVAAASVLGFWADSLEALDYRNSYGPLACLAEILPSLAHLSQLRLSGREDASCEMSVVSSLCQLRSLSWGVHSAGWRIAELPVPPQLEHLRLAGMLWRLPQHLLAHLQSLQIGPCRIHGLGPLLGLSSLTSLVMSDKYLQELPHGLSTLTALRYLDLSHNPELGDNPDFAEGFAEALRCMPYLEYLRLNECGLDELPALTEGSAPPLKALILSENGYYGGYMQDPLCLRFLEFLETTWQQVPSKELCATATKLREVAIVQPVHDNPADWEAVVEALESMEALPALRVLRFEDEDTLCYDEEQLQEALRALVQAKPELQVLKVIDVNDPAIWPVVNAPFEFAELRH